jgi:hypothetical protein
MKPTDCVSLVLWVYAINSCMERGTETPLPSQLLRYIDTPGRVTGNRMETKPSNGCAGRPCNAMDGIDQITWGTHAGE